MSTINHYIRQLRDLPAGEIRRRAAMVVRNLLRERTRKIKALLTDTVLPDREFLRSACTTPFPDAKEFVRHFRTRHAPAFLPGFVCSSGVAEAERALIVRCADRVCDHVFDLLGSGDVHLGDTIDWHADFKTGYRWNPRAWYRDITIPYSKADIKVPWELSRFSHAVVLGQAYCLTGDEKYVREFITQADHWIDSNRPQFGVNWACTMDVAIRACNWAAGYWLIKDSPSLTDEFLLKFLKSLYQHGCHIRENLEYSDILTSNHYLSNITGLVYLGVLFPEFRDAGEWKAFGVRELKQEMFKQVYPDGCDFEASTSYHRLVLELFFFPTLVAAANAPSFRGDNYPDAARSVFGGEYVERLHRMFEAVLYLLKPDGCMPQIGDNDSGRLHVFLQRDVLDMRYLLALGAVFFREGRFRIDEFGFCEEARWVFGEHGQRVWDELGGHRLSDIGSHGFPDAGWYVLRSDGNYMIISCGPNGQNGNGGHAHNDKLSLELMLNGSDLVVDPGTYVYTGNAEERNAFRSTSCHNTVTVNMLEQCPLDRGLFTLPDSAKAVCILWRSETDGGCFVGEHEGYAARGYVHRREIDFDGINGAVTVRDFVSGDDPESIAWFHFPPGIIAEFGADGIRVAGGIRFSFRHHAGLRLQESWYSAAYGLRESSQCLAVSFAERLETRISHA